MSVAESSQWILERLEPVLREQDGYFTAAQARALDLSTAKIARLLDDERTRRVRPRVYAMVEYAPVPRVPERIYSAWLAIDDKRLPWERDERVVVVSHVTAAALINIGTLPEDGDVHLTAASGSGRTRLGGIELTRQGLDLEDWRWQRDHRVMVTSAARTIVDLAVAGYDHDYVQRAASDAIARSEASPAAIEAAIDRHPRGSLRRIDWLRRWLADRGATS